MLKKYDDRQLNCLRGGRDTESEGRELKSKMPVKMKACGIAELSEMRVCRDENKEEYRPLRPGVMSVSGW